MPTKRPPLDQIRELLGKAIKRDRELIAEFKSATNPQEVAVVEGARGRVVAWEAVQEALAGSVVSLRIWAKPIQ